jgi:hypothetical protein
MEGKKGSVFRICKRLDIIVDIFKRNMFWVNYTVNNYNKLFVLGYKYSNIQYILHILHLNKF